MAQTKVALALQGRPSLAITAIRVHESRKHDTPPEHDVPRVRQQAVPSKGNVMNAFEISCDTCAMRSRNVCDDCVVTFICGREAEDAVVLDLAEQRAIRMLAAAGLVPEAATSSGLRSS